MVDGDVKVEKEAQRAWDGMTGTGRAVGGLSLKSVVIMPSRMVEAG
jgi:hypothetical protein